MGGIISLLGEFYAECVRVNLSPNTIRAHRANLSEFAAWLGSRSLSDVNATLVRRWLCTLYDRHLQPSTIRNKLASVRAFFRFCSVRKIIDRDPLTMMSTPKRGFSLPEVPEETGLNRMIDSIAELAGLRPFLERDLAVFELLYGCGLRVGELIGLNLEDVELVERWVKVAGKRGDQRQVPIPGKSAQAVARYLRVRHAGANETALITNRFGRRMSTVGIRNIVKFYACYFAGDASLHPHSLRHACATHLLNSGADLVCIKELLGHASLRTTQIYTQISLLHLLEVYHLAHPRA